MTPVSMNPSTFVDYSLVYSHKRGAYKQSASDPDANRYVSPWNVRRVRSGQTLNREVLLAQIAEHRGLAPANDLVHRWIEQLSESINGATGERRQQLIQQQDNLWRSQE